MHGGELRPSLSAPIALRTFHLTLTPYELCVVCRYHMCRTKPSHT